jgi:hypothetical protein
MVGGSSRGYRKIMQMVRNQQPTREGVGCLL